MPARFFYLLTDTARKGDFMPISLKLGGVFANKNSNKKENIDKQIVLTYIYIVK